MFAQAAHHTSRAPLSSGQKHTRVRVCHTARNSNNNKISAENHTAYIFTSNFHTFTYAQQECATGSGADAAAQRSSHSARRNSAAAFCVCVRCGEHSFIRLFDVCVSRWSVGGTDRPGSALSASGCDAGRTSSSIRLPSGVRRQHDRCHLSDVRDVCSHTLFRTTPYNKCEI